MSLALLAPVNFIDQLLLKFFSADTVNYVVWPVIQIGIVVTVVALWVAYATYLERKISAFMQARLGPMRVGPYGLLQPIAATGAAIDRRRFGYAEEMEDYSTHCV